MSIRFPKELDKVVDKYLRIWYNILNRECFNGKLPRRLNVFAKRSNEHRGCTGVCKRKAWWLFVDPRDPELVLVLLHEMVHVYQSEVLNYPDDSPEHDHAFWQKMKVVTKKLNKALNPQHG